MNFICFLHFTKHLRNKGSHDSQRFQLSLFYPRGKGERQNFPCVSEIQFLVWKSKWLGADPFEACSEEQKRSRQAEINTPWLLSINLGNQSWTYTPPPASVACKCCTLISRLVTHFCAFFLASFRTIFNTNFFSRCLIFLRKMQRAEIVTGQTDVLVDYHLYCKTILGLDKHALITAHPLPPTQS